MHEHPEVVILAAGEGTRLRPLTVSLPKTLVPVCNVPLLTQLLRLVECAGFPRATVVLPPLRDDVRDFLVTQIPARLRVRIETPVTPFQGTMQRVRDVVAGTAGNAVLVIYGDSMLSADLNALMATHRTAVKQGAAATILVHRPQDLRVSEKDCRTYHGVMEMAADGRVTSFVEKPRVAEISADAVANAAVFVCERRLFDDERFRTARDFSYDLFQRAVSEDLAPLYACFIGDGFRIDVGSISRFVDVNLRVLRQQLAWSIPGTQQRPGVWVAGGTAIDAVRVVPPAAFGAGIRLDADAQIGPEAILGDACVVGARAVVRHSIVMQHCTIGSDAVIEDCVLGMHTSVAPGVTLPPHSVIGPYSVVGGNADGQT